MTGWRQDDPERDDRDLLRAHVEGDADAFGILFARHRDRLWAVALRTSGDPEEAADALQDALVSAFRRADSYRGDSAVTTWLHRIVVNACLDRHRRQKVRRTEPLPAGDTADRGDRAEHQHPVGSAPDRSDADPADAAVGRDRRDAVLRALATLPADQRAALVLVDMEGYSVEETASILGCPPGTVKSRCARGRARLLPLLEQHAEAGGRNPAPPSRVGSAGGRAVPGAATATGAEEEVSDGDA